MSLCRFFPHGTKTRKKQSLPLSPLSPPSLPPSLLNRRRNDAQVVVIHAGHAKDLARVHARADHAQPHLGPRRDARGFVRRHERGLARGGELVVVGDEVVGDKDLKKRGEEGVGE